MRRSTLHTLLVWCCLASFRVSAAVLRTYAGSYEDCDSPQRYPAVPITLRSQLSIPPVTAAGSGYPRTASSSAQMLSHWVRTYASSWNMPKRIRTGAGSYGKDLASRSPHRAAKQTDSFCQ